MRVAIVPPVPALLPSRASLSDPVAPLRTACAAAVAWLGPSVRVVADDEAALRVGEALLGRPSDPAGTALLVMANGSACRSERAPGHLDERAAAFDAHLGDLLARGDAAGLAALDLDLGAELLAAGLSSLASLSGLVVESSSVDHADDPFGVQWWVVRWACADPG